MSSACRTRFGRPHADSTGCRVAESAGPASAPTRRCDTRRCDTRFTRAQTGAGTVGRSVLDRRRYAPPNPECGGITAGGCVTAQSRSPWAMRSVGPAAPHPPVLRDRDIGSSSGVLLSGTGFVSGFAIRPACRCWACIRGAPTPDPRPCPRPPPGRQVDTPHTHTHTQPLHGAGGRPEHARPAALRSADHPTLCREPEIHPTHTGCY